MTISERAIYVDARPVPRILHQITHIVDPIGDDGHGQCLHSTHFQKRRC